MTTMIEDSFSKQCSVSNYEYGYDDLGYGDGAPDVAKYGYDDGAPSTSSASEEVDYGYGEASPEVYGYGDASPEPHQEKARDADYGYGDASPDAPTGGSGDEEPRRPRRRNSVTRYSIVDADKVQNEFTEHSNIIDQMRNGGPPAEYSAPVKDSGNSTSLSRSGHSSNSYESSDDDTTDGDKKKRSGLGSRWRIGRNASKGSKN